MITYNGEADSYIESLSITPATERKLKAWLSECTCADIDKSGKHERRYGISKKYYIVSGTTFITGGNDIPEMWTQAVRLHYKDFIVVSAPKKPRTKKARKPKGTLLESAGNLSAMLLEATMSAGVTA